LDDKRKVGQRPAFFVSRCGVGTGGAEQRESMGTDKAATVERVIAPSLKAMGYEVVRVMVMGAHRPVLQIMIERSDRAVVGVEDCAEVSRAVSALLDVEDPIAGSYTLEVSSPGIDRPLIRPEDFVRFAGFEAKLETRAPIDGRKRFRGRLMGLEGDRVRIATAEGESLLPIGDVERAKLVLTDELIAATAKPAS
jgi:ribosome maturation factor RimP